jgi:predicted DNA binding CopG/RHH family protein
MKKRIKLPKFKNEKEEHDFWAKVNLSDYLDLKDFEPVIFPNLKPTSRSISIRLPEYLLIRLKEQANELDVPYQTLMKQYIAKGVKNKIKM